MILYFTGTGSFYVSGDCISCGSCERNCPLGNIRMENEKPVFGKNCTACCSCIQRCPKSALVGDWISFYRKQHRWAGGNYIPHSGDFIVFDWEGDGEPDHIGIVESCDGKTHIRIIAYTTRPSAPRLPGK